jgi:hypothetical protein
MGTVNAVRLVCSRLPALARAMALLALTGTAPSSAVLAQSTSPDECTEGQLVDFCTAIPADIPPAQGFLLDQGVYTTLRFPDAVLTAMQEINNRGQMVGTFRDAQGIVRGFLLDDGVFRTIDAPEPSSETVLFGINNRGQMLGGYIDQAGARVSFVLDNNGFSLPTSTTAARWWVSSSTRKDSQRLPHDSQRPRGADRSPRRDAGNRGAVAVLHRAIRHQRAGPDRRRVSVNPRLFRIFAIRAAPAASSDRRASCSSSSRNGRVPFQSGCCPAPARHA